MTGAGDVLGALAPTLAALAAWRRASHADKQTRAVGDGFAENVTTTLERVDGRVDRIDRRVDDLSVRNDERHMSNTRRLDFLEREAVQLRERLEDYIADPHAARQRKRGGPA